MGSRARPPPLLDDRPPDLPAQPRLDPLPLRDQPPQQPLGGLQPPPRIPDPPLRPLLLGAGPPQLLPNLVVVLDQALDPHVHALDDPLHPRRLGPQPHNLVRRRLARSSNSDRLLEPTRNHPHGKNRRQDEDDATPEQFAGEVPPALGSEVRNPLTPRLGFQILQQIPVRVRPTLPEITK
jgi:hypothetical protein